MRVSRHIIISVFSLAFHTFTASPSLNRAVVPVQAAVIQVPQSVGAVKAECENAAYLPRLVLHTLAASFMSRICLHLEKLPIARHNMRAYDPSKETDTNYKACNLSSRPIFSLPKKCLWTGLFFAGSGADSTRLGQGAVLGEGPPGHADPAINHVTRTRPRGATRPQQVLLQDLLLVLSGGVGVSTLCSSSTSQCVAISPFTISAITNYTPARTYLSTHSKSIGNSDSKVFCTLVQG